MRRGKGGGAAAAVLVFGLLATADEAAAEPFTPDKLMRIQAPALAEKIRDKKAGKKDFRLVDLRSQADFSQGSIPAAENVPLKLLSFVAETRFQPSEDIVFFGHSVNDKAAANAVILLYNKGYRNLHLFEDGFAGWDARLLEETTNSVTEKGGME